MKKFLTIILLLATPLVSSAVLSTTPWRYDTDTEYTYPYPNHETQRVAVGTTTPYSRFTVWGISTGLNPLAQFVNNASTSLVHILENGQFGIRGTPTRPNFRIYNDGTDTFLGGYASTSGDLDIEANPSSAPDIMAGNLILSGGIGDGLSSNGYVNIGKTLVGPPAGVAPGNNRGNLGVSGTLTVASFAEFQEKLIAGGIPAGNPTYDISLQGQADRTIGAERNFTTATAGKKLTVSAGGAFSGGTNLNGGNLNLMPGIPTGTGSSSVVVVAYGGGSTGTTDGTAATSTIFGYATTTVMGDLVSNTLFSGFGGFRVATDGAISRLGNIAVNLTGNFLQMLNAGGDIWLQNNTSSASSGVAIKAGTNANNAASAIKFEAGGSERMRILGDGLVGIATTTPNNILDIFSTTKPAIGFSGASGPTFKWTIGQDVTNGGIFAIASSTALGTNNRLTIDGNGNVTVPNFLTIPNGTAPSFGVTGQIGYDTTDGQFLVATTTANTPAVIPTIQKLWSATVASTSVDFISGGRIPLPPQRDGVAITEIHCFVDGGALKEINLDVLAGGSNTDTVTCGTSLTSDTSMSANSNLAAGTLMALELGATTGSVDYVTFSVWGKIVRE